MSSTSNKTAGVDKEQLYGKYQRTADWQDNLHRQLAHKALDIGAQDEMQVDNSRNNLGLTWKELSVIGGLILGAYYLYGQSQMQPPAQQQIPAQASPTDSEYEVRFFDAEGNPIKIEPLPRK